MTTEQTTPVSGSISGQHLQPVPPEPVEIAPQSEEKLESTPSCYRSGRKIILENGGAVPTDHCIKSGRRASKQVAISLRNPKNPKTWFGKQPVVNVGLSKKHHENHVVAVALTWSTLAVGALVLLAGILTLSLASCFVGIVAIAVSGIFRAYSPVTSIDATPEYATIEGAGDGFLKLVAEGSDPYS
ncbi:MAG: hypothetical protein CMO55_27960 [Verrucomicrobiales bacterium]|nr:hypothetical protein [Verrucomicrobiales bacterium]